MCETDEQMRMKEIKRNTSRDTDKQLVRLAFKQTECTRDRHTQRQTDWHANRQNVLETDTPKDRQTGMQRERMY